MYLHESAACDGVKKVISNFDKESAGGSKGNSEDGCGCGAV